MFCEHCFFDSFKARSMVDVTSVMDFVMMPMNVSVYSARTIKCDHLEYTTKVL